MIETLRSAYTLHGIRWLFFKQKNTRKSFRAPSIEWMAENKNVSVNEAHHLAV